MCSTHSPGPGWGMRVCVCAGTWAKTIKTLVECLKTASGENPESGGACITVSGPPLPNWVVPFPCVGHSFLICTTGVRPVAASPNRGVNRWGDETKHSLRACQPLVNRKSCPELGRPRGGPWVEVTLRVTTWSIISCAHPTSRLENPAC